MVLTAPEVQRTIFKWKTRVFSSVPFEDGVYGPVYAEHVAKLEDFELMSEGDRIVTDIGSRIAKIGR
ncbi:hypothetical protein C8Q76DRAFT_800903 [Earliella scabrosa]|nr:hypothetical protein C8Q76DRAFT_800903 [Earliella scabrosa]